jgi:hypothetical protein
MGGTFALTDSWVANVRRKDDHLNGVAAGCAAGFLAGIRGMSYFPLLIINLGRVLVVNPDSFLS